MVTFEYVQHNGGLAIKCSKIISGRPMPLNMVHYLHQPVGEMCWQLLKRGMAKPSEKVRVMQNGRRIIEGPMMTVAEWAADAEQDHKDGEAA